MSMIAFVSGALALAAVCTCCAASEAGSPAGPLTGPPAGLHAGEALLAAVQDSDVPRVRRVLDGLRRDGRSLPGPGRYGKTVLHEAAHTGAGPGGAEIVGLLVAAGADPNGPNAVGLTPLHFAAFNAGGGPLARALVGRGARVDARDDEGRTPLHVAAGPATTRALLDLGSDPRATAAAGATPLHGGSADVALLVAAGADPNAADRDGFTPLHYAAYTADAGRARALLAAGASVNARTTAAYLGRPARTPREFGDDPTDDVPAGATPLDIARRKHDRVKWATGKWAGVVGVLEAAGGRTATVRTTPRAWIVGGAVVLTLGAVAGTLALVARAARG